MLNLDRSITTLGNHEVLPEFPKHHVLLNQLLIHDDVLKNFCNDHDFLTTFQKNFPLEDVEPCQSLNQFIEFISLEISDIFFSIPIQHFSSIFFGEMKHQ